MRYFFITFFLCFFVSTARAGDIPSLYGVVDTKVLNDEITALKSKLKESPEDGQLLRRLGIAYHNLGIIETEGAPEKAEHYLEQAVKANEHDNVSLAFLGSAKTLIARDSWNVLTKMSMLNEGIELIDKAVNNAPEEIAVRLVRANNSAHLPKLAGREKYALSDLLFLETLSKKTEGKVPEEVLAEVCYKAARIYREKGDEDRANQYFEKSAAFPYAPYGKKALDALNSERDKE